MLFYDKITESDGLDTSEGTDIIRAGAVSCKRFDFCHFYFFENRNLFKLFQACLVCQRKSLWSNGYGTQPRLRVCRSNPNEDLTNSLMSLNS